MLTTLEKVLFLHQVPLLATVPTEALAHLARVARVEEKAAGFDLWRRGEPSADVWFVVEGEVAVDDGKARQLVALHQIKRRTCDFEVLAACKMPDQGAGERGFAGAEITRQRDEIARLDDAGEIDCKRAGRGFVGQ